MKIRRSAIVNGGEGEVYILDVKCEEGFKDLLISSRAGYYPAYHMNKSHWITVLLDGTVPEQELYAAIDESYVLVNRNIKSRKRGTPYSRRQKYSYLE